MECFHPSLFGLQSFGPTPLFSPFTFFLMPLHFLSVSQGSSKLTVCSGAVPGVMFFLFVKLSLSRLLCVSFHSKAWIARGLEVGGLVRRFWLGMAWMLRLPWCLPKGALGGTPPSSASHTPHKHLHEHQSNWQPRTEISLWKRTGLWVCRGCVEISILLSFIKQ